MFPVWSYTLEAIVRTIKIGDFVRTLNELMFMAQQPDVAIAFRMNARVNGQFVWVEGKGESPRKTEFTVTPLQGSAPIHPSTFYGLLTGIFPNFGSAADKVFQAFEDADTSDENGWVVLRLSSQADGVDFDAEICDSI